MAVAGGDAEVAGHRPSTARARRRPLGTFSTAVQASSGTRTPVSAVSPQDPPSLGRVRSPSTSTAAASETLRRLSSGAVSGTVRPVPHRHLGAMPHVDMSARSGDTCGSPGTPRAVVCRDLGFGRRNPRAHIVVRKPPPFGNNPERPTVKPSAPTGHHTPGERPPELGGCSGEEGGGLKGDVRLLLRSGDHVSTSHQGVESFGSDGSCRPCRSGSCRCSWVVLVRGRGGRAASPAGS